MCSAICDVTFCGIVVDPKHCYLSVLFFYSAKSQPPYDKHMPPQGHPYPPGQMAPPPMYASHPPAMGVTRFVSPVDAGSGRLSPRGDEEPWKKNEKEEAVERARKRREEEEKRLMFLTSVV